MESMDSLDLFVNSLAFGMFEMLFLTASVLLSNESCDNTIATGLLGLVELSLIVCFSAIGLMASLDWFAKSPAFDMF